MTNLPKIGDSLEQRTTLQSQAKRVEKAGGLKDIGLCPSCKQLPLPRGYDIMTKKCWWCAFPRKTTDAK